MTTVELVPVRCVCLHCNKPAVLYPSTMAETGGSTFHAVVACDACSPPWLRSFLLSRLDIDREAAGLGPITEGDLPTGVLLETVPTVFTCRYRATR